jgi:biotin carboxyl carrier protein
MRVQVDIGGQARAVELERSPRGWSIRLDGRPVNADAVEISPGVYSILLEGRSYDVRVAPAPGGADLHIQAGEDEFAARILDPRVWLGRRHDILETEGRQQITAPMPGKVVRVLIRQGDRVEAGQGLLVVEAMKMQNEIRSPKSGIVERLFVAEGQAVNAGETLVIVS